MRRLVVVSLVAVFAVAVVTTALAQITASDEAKLSHPGDQFTVNVHQKFAAIERVNLVFTFATENPLDPGENLSFTPISALKDDPGAGGPGFVNVTTTPEYSRAIGVDSGNPMVTDALLDGRETFQLSSTVGSVTVTGVTVSIVGDGR